MTTITDADLRRAHKLRASYFDSITTANTSGAVEFRLAQAVASNAVMAALGLLSPEGHDLADKNAHRAAYTRHRKLCQPTQPA